MEDDALVRFISTVAFCGSLAMTGVSMAEDLDAGSVARERKVRALAVSIGNAYSCTAKSSQELFKQESHHLFDLIVQDVGSDLAFVYATGIGYGSALPKDKLDCPALLKQWEEIREDYELKGDDE